MPLKTVSVEEYLKSDHYRLSGLNIPPQDIISASNKNVGIPSDAKKGFFDARKKNLESLQKGKSDDSLLDLTKPIQPMANMRGGQQQAEPTEQPQEKGFVDKQMETSQNLFSGIGKAFTERTEKGSEAGYKAIQGEQGLGSATLQMLGQGAGFVGDVGFEAGKYLFDSAGNFLSGVTPDVLEKPAVAAVKKVGDQLLQTDAAKAGIAAFQAGAETWGNFKKENPEAAGNIEAVVNLASLIPGVKGAKVGAEGAGAIGKEALSIAKEGVEKGAEAVSKKTGDVYDLTKGAFRRKPVRTEDAIKSVKDNLLSQIEGKKASMVKLDKTRSDVLDTISSDPRYHPEIDVENKTFNTQNAVNELNADINELGTKTRELFSVSDEIDGGVPVQQVVDDVKKTLFTERNRAKLAVAGEGFGKELERKMQNIANVYGDTIPRQDLWDIRKSIDDDINKLSDTNLKRDLTQSVRAGFANSLERIPGENASLVKRSMAEMQKLIEARDYSKDVLGTFKIRGGKLTDIIRSGVGTAIGGVTGGIGGAVAGYVLSNKIGSYLAKNTLSSAAERRTLAALIKERPDILDEIDGYIGNLKGVEKRRAEKNINDVIDIDTKEGELKKIVGFDIKKNETGDKQNLVSGERALLGDGKTPEQPQKRIVSDEGNNKTKDVATIEDGVSKVSKGQNEIYKEATLSKKTAGGSIDTQADEIVARAKTTKPSQTADPLIVEAKKYKSAEEFVKAQGTPVKNNIEVRDKIGTKLRDPYTGEYLPVNNDGTIRVYHSTTKESAEKIIQNGLVGSKVEDGDIYFTTNPKGYGGIGKGKGVVLAFDVDPKKIKFDDVYRGELHLKGNNTDIGGIKPIKTKSQLTDIWNKANNK